MHSNILYFVIGILGLWFSGELAIYASKTIAKYFKLSETFIGLTVLSIGTSLGELGMHIASSLQVLQGNDLSGLAISTNIGSNLIQITLILGIVALFMKIRITKGFLKKDYLIMLGSIILVWILSLNHYLGRLEGFLLFFLYGYYIFTLCKKERILIKRKKSADTHHLAFILVPLIMGLFGILFFAELIVNHTTVIASQLNMQYTLIGAIILGAGTALPELTSSLIALRRKSVGMSIGVLVGSNITNPLMMLGIGALISGHTVANEILWFDLPALFFVSVIPFVFLWRHLTLRKWHAVALVLLYVLYVVVRTF